MQVCYDLITDLNNSDYLRRTNSINAIPQLAKELGPSRTVSELIPFIFSMNRDRREVINIMLQIEAIDYSLYLSEDIDRMIEALECLNSYEDVSIISAIAESLSNICLKQSPSDINKLIKKFLNCETPTVGVILYGKLIGLLDVKSQSELFKLITEQVKLHSKSGCFRKSIIRMMKLLLENSCYDVDAKGIMDIIMLLCDGFSPVFECEIPDILVLLRKRGFKLDEMRKIYEQLLKSTEWRVRLFAVMKLGALHSDWLDEQFLLEEFKSIVDDDEDVRIAGCNQLTCLPDMDTVYESFIRDPSRNVRLAFVEALTKSDNWDTVSAYVFRLLNEDDASTVLTAMRVFKSHNGNQETLVSVILSFLQKHKDDYRGRRLLVSAIPSLGIQSEDVMEEALRDEAIAVRYAAANVLRLIGTREQWLPLIKDLLKSEDYQIRQTAIVCIEKLNLWEQVDVETLVKDPISNVRITIARLLPNSYVDIKQELSRDPDPDVRVMCPGSETKLYL